MKNLSLLSILCILALLLCPSAKLYADSPLQRVAGNDRYQTTIQISQKGWPDKSAYVIIATGQNFVDALCAAPLSQKYNCPILLNIKENLLSSTKKEIQRLEAKNAVIIGGTGAISENVENELKAISLSCTRISEQARNNHQAIPVCLGQLYVDMQARVRLLLRAQVQPLTGSAIYLSRAFLTKSTMPNIVITIYCLQLISELSAALSKLNKYR
jgi:hypothetical protein